MTPLVGRKVWFAPRGDGLGVGWAPVSWEGWLATVVAVGVAVVSLLAFAGDEAVALAGGGAMLALVALCFLKGTSPGGRRRRAEYDRARAEQEQLDRNEWLEAP